MASIAIKMAALLLAVTPISGRTSATPVKFWLYPWNSGCLCIKTAKATRTVYATETRANRIVYEVFHGRKDAGKELFRIEIGWNRKDIEDPFNKMWNYGIANESDINGDGKPDYSWYGGDDTGEEEYLFLSSGDSYPRVDVLKTFEAAWNRRFHKRSADLGDSDNDCHATAEWLEKTGNGLVLHGTIHCESSAGGKKSAHVFNIPESDFVP